jgi:hypothetical protein
MIRLTDDQRTQLMAVLEGSGGFASRRASNPAARRRQGHAFCRQSHFSTAEEVAHIASLFEAGGVDGIAQYKPK